MKELFQDNAEPAFVQKINKAKALFASLEDREAGFSGAKVLDRLERNGLTFEAAGADQCGFASYRSFDAGLDRSYINVVTCRATDRNGVERSESDIDVSVAHEIVHADSWDRVPEYHATPFNKNTPIILCPEDHAKMVAIAERVAYSTTGWLLSLAQKDHPELADIVTPVTGTRFAALRAQEKDLGRALARAADEGMGLIWGKDVKRDNALLTMEQYYHWSALEGYETQTLRRAAKGDLPIVVRLEPHNLIALARSFGPNIMEVGQAPAPLRPLDRAWVDDIYKKLGALARVPSYDRLPTFDQGLARFGLTPERFLDMSKTAGIRAPLPVTAPESRPARAYAGLVPA